jgi:hypothetical protein
MPQTCCPWCRASKRALAGTAALREPKVKPHCVADCLRRKSVALMGGRLVDL